VAPTDVGLTTAVRTLRFARVFLAVVGDVVQFGRIRHPHRFLLRLDVRQRMTHVRGAGGGDVIEGFSRQVRRVIGLHARPDRLTATDVRRPVAGQTVERIGRWVVDVHLMTELGRQVPTLICH